MSEPACPVCGAPSELDASGSKVVLCHYCRRSAANWCSNGILNELRSWLEGSDMDFIGYFNLLAMGVFQHATSYRLAHPTSSCPESWRDFCYKPDGKSSAERLYRLISDGHWPEINTAQILSHIKNIHDAAFYGQWAVPVGDVTTQTIKDHKGASDERHDA